MHRGDLFESAWPRFRSDARATTVSFEVREGEIVEELSEPRRMALFVAEHKVERNLGIEVLVETDVLHKLRGGCLAR